MPIIKETIMSNGLDTTIKFALGTDNRLSGYQQEIDDLTEETKDELINPIIDNEVSRFSFVTGSVRIWHFFFDSINPPSFTNAGFTTDELTSSSTNLLNSFFIMDYYDTFDPYTQTKIFTIYNTQILDGGSSGGVPTPQYVLNNDNLNQFYHWFIPKSYLNEQTGSTATGYVKFSFYNAKTGYVYLFFNQAIVGNTTPEKMYFKTELNLVNRTWEFTVAPAILGGISMYELPRTSAYADRVNDAVENFEALQQNGPDGAFNPEDGKYEGGT